jgi:hypothetical protein
VDNGFPCTVLDKSLEPELGKPSGTQKVSYAWFSNTTITTHKYKSPKLYLGNTPLMLGEFVITDDLKQKFQGRPVAGILGMDCLKHYCIQLDFISKKIHFLDPDHLQSGNLGKPFPLSFSFIEGEPSARMDFCGKDAWFNLDTGDYTDGTLETALLERTMKTHSPDKVLQTKTETGATRSKFYFSELEFGGETYTNLLIHKSSDGADNNALGPWPAISGTESGHAEFSKANDVSQTDKRWVFERQKQLNRKRRRRDIFVETQTKNSPAFALLRRGKPAPSGRHRWSSRFSVSIARTS